MHSLTFFSSYSVIVSTIGYLVSTISADIALKPDLQGCWFYGSNLLFRLNGSGVYS